MDCSNRSHGRHGRCSLAWSTGIQNIRKTVGCLVDEFCFSLLQFASWICRRTHLDNSLGGNSKQHSDNTGQSYKYIHKNMCMYMQTHTHTHTHTRKISAFSDTSPLIRIMNLYKDAKSTCKVTKHCLELNSGSVERQGQNTVGYFLKK